MRRIFRALYLITFVAALPSAIGVGASLPVSAWLAVLIAVALASVAPILLAGRLELITDDRPIGRVRGLFERLFFMHWGAAIASVPLSFVALPLALALDVRASAALLAAYAVGTAVACFSVFVRPRLVRVREIVVPVEDLPAPFDGYRIAQLSDLHVGSLCPSTVIAGWVRTANELDVDLVALTGDYVTMGNRFHAIAAHELSRLRARDGVAAVLGNHDNACEGEPLRSGLVAGGVRLLMNERFTVERGGATMTIAGVDDIYSGRADVARTLAGARAPVVALAHDPKHFDAISRYDVALVLAGHTHWGQIGVPFFSRRMNLARGFFRYHADLYRRTGTAMYVHPGMGTTGPPIRFGVAPEIAVFRLKRAATSP
ncbi:MAG: metallophosphoesterase [Polyangiaceae bacterium]